MRSKISRYTFEDLRKIKGFTLEKISKETGIPVETIKDIERDSSETEPEVYKKLAKLYNIDSNYVFIGRTESQALKTDLALSDIERRNKMILDLTNSMDDQLGEINKHPTDKIMYANGNLEELDLLKDCIYELMKINISKFSVIQKYFEETEFVND